MVTSARWAADAHHVADETIARIIAAVAPDLDRAGYDRARRECADELRAGLHPWYEAQDRMQELIERWSSSGRAPAGEEEQR